MAGASRLARAVQALVGLTHGAEAKTFEIHPISSHSRDDGGLWATSKSRVTNDTGKHRDKRNDRAMVNGRGGAEPGTGPDLVRSWVEPRAKAASFCSCKGRTGRFSISCRGCSRARARGCSRSGSIRATGRSGATARPIGPISTCRNFGRTWSRICWRRSRSPISCFTATRGMSTPRRCARPARGGSPSTVSKRAICAPIG